jgi:hypothetical protein
MKWLKRPEIEAFTAMTHRYTRFAIAAQGRNDKLGARTDAAIDGIGSAKQFIYS